MKKLCSYVILNPVINKGHFIAYALLFLRNLINGNNYRGVCASYEHETVLNFMAGLIHKLTGEYIS